MQQHHLLPLVIATALAVGIPSSQAQTIFLDDFNVANTTNINDGIATRQASGIVTSTYTVGSSDDPETNDTSIGIANMQLELQSTGDADGPNDVFAALDTDLTSELAGTIWTLTYTIELDAIDPFGDLADGWGTVMINGEPVGEGSGPNGAPIGIAILFRLDGRYTIWSEGTPVVNPGTSDLLTGDTHDIEIIVDDTGGTALATVRIDGAAKLQDHPFSFTTGRYLGMRNHIGGGFADEDVTQISRYDDLKAEVTFVPPPFLIDDLVRGSETGIEFASEPGQVYQLQYTLDPAATSMWQSAGIQVDGTGGTHVLFDPSGFSTQKTYRVFIP